MTSQPGSQKTNPGADPTDERVAALLQEQLPRMIQTAVKLPKSRAILLHYLTMLLPELDRFHNWNNCDPATNGEHWLIERVVPQCRVILDIGANVGDWTQACLDINPQARLYSFEASPATAAQLIERFQSNPNVETFALGLGEKQAILEFHDHGPGSVCSGFVSRERTVERKAQTVVPVACKPIVDAPGLENVNPIDFMKIDTEGFEMPILRGAEPWLEERRVRLIQFEYGGAWADAREFLSDANVLFKKHGYRWGRLMQAGIEWVTQFDHRRLETFKYANFIACASEDEAHSFGLS